MRYHSLPVGIIAIACCLLAHAAPVRAAASQTWVSGTGADAGTTCPITAPCRTFQYAYNQTNTGGTIHVLTSGIFGPLTISKSISIIAEGVEAFINTAVGGAAITINGAGFVWLRGLTIDLFGLNTGISFISGFALHVQDTQIRRAIKGISFAPASGTGELYVTDTVIALGTTGIDVRPTGSAGVKATINRVRVENGQGTGFLSTGAGTTGAIAATVRDSVFAGNSTGISAAVGGGGTATVIIDRSASVNNTTGIFVGSGAKIQMGDSTVSGNNTGLSGSGVIESFGTNKIIGNTNAGAIPTKIDMN